ncbi:hypothetical protein [Candidatus Methylobacter favarea]|uniref:hypothetical protein n=1 Tax=Candidatus Methylobacter favarea TaxID=2707345 RepID=UPI00157C7429|nr:hypothetical protein [Candidatus Methylobacter favarea]
MQSRAVGRRVETAKAINLSRCDGFDRSKYPVGLEPRTSLGWIIVKSRRSRSAMSHERIYHPIWMDKSFGSELYKHLRQGRKKRKKQYRSKVKRGRIRNLISIDERPGIVEQKTRWAMVSSTPFHKDDKRSLSV